MPRFKPVADRALLVEFASEISDSASRDVVALDRAIASAELRGVQETVPAFVNLLAIFDPMVTDHAALEADIRALLPLPDVESSDPTRHEVLVCYDDDLAPDLMAVAQACDLAPEAVIAAHLAAIYKVGMYGFAPGYAYLSGTPAAIQVPRKPAPVRDIAAGSVMIAGPQCLTTTLKMPTGWSVIGRSPTKILLDDPERPFLFDVGDEVVFRRISRDRLDAMQVG